MERKIPKRLPEKSQRSRRKRDRDINITMTGEEFDRLNHSSQETECECTIHRENGRTVPQFSNTLHRYRIQYKLIEVLLLLACAITHQSHVQGTVLEPCSRHNVQLNESMDPLRWAVDGTASTSDVFCRLFGTTHTTITSGQSPAQHVCA